jgi:hypothetical protein
MRIQIYCCGCGVEVSARLTSGKEIYPHRKDLAELPFWRCDDCKNFVGCHHKTRDRTKPLGSIPTPEIRNARSHIHKVLDPLWRSRRFDRSALYQEIASRLGIAEYHTAEVNSVEQAREVYRAVRDIERGSA